MLLIQHIDEVEIPELIQLSKKSLGEGYLTIDYFKKVVFSERYYSWKIVDEKNGLIAFLVAYKTSFEEVYEKTGNRNVTEKMEIPLYCLDTMVVETSYRRKGLGKRLINEAIQSLGEGSHYIMYTWKQGEKINMQGIAEFFQFYPLKEYNGFWEKGCVNGEFKCPAKIEKCVCSMVLYYR